MAHWPSNLAELVRPGSVRDHVLKNKVKAKEGRSRLWPPQACVHTHTMDTIPTTCTQTHKKKKEQERARQRVKASQKKNGNSS